jgi:hypothetical protein
MIFLLGGYDLEMLEIKEILNKENINYEDKKLSWGAKLSDYKDLLEKYEDKNLIIYGVELEADITLPKNYVEIDHHGKNDDKPSSLEQVAKILDIELSCEQKLIAANDSRYICGMKSLCATKEKIDEIRKKDREAQGITIQDEQLAKESLEVACNNNSNLIFSKTSKFSAVSDLAYEKFDNYVIYDDTKIVFYGYKKENILEFLKSQNIDESNYYYYYYGGGEFGFVGIKDNFLTKQQINDVIEEFKKLNLKENLYSYHTFMLPFRFDKILGKIDNKNKYYKDKNIDERIKITKKFKESLEKDGWKFSPFKMNTNYDYNEYSYFYDFIRETIYNKSEFDENETSYYFEKPYTDGKFHLNAKNQNFELDFEGISLRLFDTGIGIFTIELANKKVLQSDINSILKINDFARRIYPQYLGRRENHDNWTQAPKNSILPTSIEIKLPNKTKITEDFCKDYKEVPSSIKISDYILTLLGKETFTDSLNDNDKYLIQPIIDDRMFVLSWYGNDSYSETLRDYKYIKNDKWYEYVFIDGDGKTIHSPNMQEELIKESTYDRWMNYPYGTTLYGLTRYSFVCLTKNSSFTQEILPLPHVKTMYFQMFTLLLAIRASTLRFSQEVTALSDIEKEDINLSENISNLYKNYIRFVNKIYFREITAQEQGIELYNKACELMRIHEDVKDLNSEIEKLHSYSDLIGEKSRNDKLGLISKIGAILLPPSLLAGLFGMNVLVIDATPYNQFLALFLVFLSGVIGFSLINNINYDKSKDMKKIIVQIKDIILKLKFKLLIIFIVIFLIFTNKKNPPDPQEVKITNQPIEVNLSDKKGEK